MNEYDVFKVFGNKNRVLMLKKLVSMGGCANHSDLSYRMGLNPKSTKDHLAVLMKYGILEKTNPGYTLTEKGNRLVVLLEYFIIQIKGEY